jgi:hypothetical protein
MAHIYMSFDFGTDEEKAQQARHKLEMWKQAFRLDKKLLYKFERTGTEGEATQSEEGGLKPVVTTAKKDSTKAAKTGKSKSKTEDKESARASANGNVKLYLRFAFSGHEKMTQERLLKKFPSEEPFSEMPAETVKDGDAEFGEFETKFDSLE